MNIEVFADTLLFIGLLTLAYMFNRIDPPFAAAWIGVTYLMSWQRR